LPDIAFVDPDLGASLKYLASVRHPGEAALPGRASGALKIRMTV
jgi:hypothetical protein